MWGGTWSGSAIPVLVCISSLLTPGSIFSRTDRKAVHRFVGSVSEKMVTKTEETQLNRLENQVDNGGGGAWEYLCLVRKLKVRRSEKVLKHGLSILNDLKQRSSLGSDGPSSYATDLIFLILLQLCDSYFLWFLINMLLCLFFFD